jgi:hypothetical protein
MRHQFILFVKESIKFTKEKPQSCLPLWLESSRVPPCYGAKVKPQHVLRGVGVWQVWRGMKECQCEKVYRGLENVYNNVRKVERQEIR